MSLKEKTLREHILLDTTHVRQKISFVSSQLEKIWQWTTLYVCTFCTKSYTLKPWSLLNIFVCSENTEQRIFLPLCDNQHAVSATWNIVVGIELCSRNSFYKNKTLIQRRLYNKGLNLSKTSASTNYSYS